MKNEKTSHGLSGDEMINYIVAKGYITSGSLYNNSKCIDYIFLPDKLSAKNPNLYKVEYLGIRIQGPLLPDDIIDVTNGVLNRDARKHIKRALSLYDMGIFNFYQSNKLHASNLSEILEYIDHIVLIIPLSNHLMSRIEAIYSRLSPKNMSGKYLVNKYIYDFSISEKIAAAIELTDVAEDVLIETARYFKINPFFKKPKNKK